MKVTRLILLNIDYNQGSLSDFHIEPIIAVTECSDLIEIIYHRKLK